MIKTLYQTNKQKLKDQHFTAWIRPDTSRLVIKIKLRLRHFIEIDLGCILI